MWHLHTVTVPPLITSHRTGLGTSKRTSESWKPTGQIACRTTRESGGNYAWVKSDMSAHGVWTGSCFKQFRTL